MNAPETMTVELIRCDVLELLRDTSESGLHPDSKILLATIIFADDEGVAELSDTTLRRWCAMPGQKRAGSRFVQRRIDHLIDVGVLAPGSTATELRSMVGRAGKPKTARGRRGRRGGKGSAVTATGGTDLRSGPDGNRRFPETTAKTEEVAA